MSNPRDEHFMGFARAVVEEITGRDEYDECDMEEVIAQRAYDLMKHTIGHSLEYLHECGISTSGSMNSRIQQAIPDLPVLPE